MLGRYEYQKGNIEAALHVFEGIDIAAVISRIKASISTRYEQNRRQSQSDVVPTMSMHAISLLLEAIFLKAKSLQGLGRFVGSFSFLSPPSALTFSKDHFCPPPVFIIFPFCL